MSRVPGIRSPMGFGANTEMARDGVPTQGGEHRMPRHYSDSMQPNTATAAAGTAQSSTVMRALARAGYAFLGLLHIVIGVIAISIAVGAGGEADQGGAFEEVSHAPFGIVLLWLIAIGLASLTVWEIAEAFLEREPQKAKRWAKRAKHVGTAVAYVVDRRDRGGVRPRRQSDSSESTGPSAPR